MKFLITGGAGYIGSTIASALLDAGHTPVILDSLVTGRIEYSKDRIFYKGDIADAVMVKKIFTEHPDLGAIALAVLTYGYSLFSITGSEQYPALIFRTLVLVTVLAAGTWVMYGIIRERTHKEQPGSTGQSPAVSDQDTKDEG